MSRPLACISLFIFASLSVAAPIHSSVSLYGKGIGGNTYSIDAQGNFTSTTQFEVGSAKVDSKLTGVLKGGKVIEWSLEESTNGTKGAVKWKDGKANATQNGKAVATNKKTEMKGILFSPLHPQLASLQISDVLAKKEKLSLFLANALQTFEVPVRATTRTVDFKSGATRVLKWTITINGTELEYAANLDGTTIMGMQVPAQKLVITRDNFEAAFVDPVLAYPELSQPTLQTVVEKSVATTTRDGVKLVSIITRPKDDEKHPTILVRTPYGRAESAANGDFWASRGYVWMAQDVRGRGDSDGVWDPFNMEVKDGEDTLTWITKQPWSDGKVGMIGASYLGFVQWAAAVTHHPALRCIIPQVSPSDPVHNIPIDNGAFLLSGSLWWANIVKSKNADLALANAKMPDVSKYLTKPLDKIDDAMFGKDIPFFNWFTHRPTIQDWPGSFREDQISSVKIPVLHVSGTWDGDGVGTMMHWEALRGTDTPQWLIFGPWEHGFNVHTKFGSQEYGPGSILELDSVYLRFFDTFLKGREVNWSKQPKVRFFVTGANYWERASDFPLPSSRREKMFLSHGSLSPTPQRGSDLIIYDPNKVKVSQSGLDADTSATQVKLSDMRGSLPYRTAAFEQPTTITGPIELDLSISTTARDATFHTMVLDEDEKGKLEICGLPGTMRASLVNGKIQPMTPGKIYHVKIKPWLFAHQFPAGHRLVLVVTSDLFPGFARNPGTGQWEGNATKYVKATHTIYFDAAHPSSVSWQRQD